MLIFGGKRNSRLITPKTLHDTPKPVNKLHSTYIFDQQDINKRTSEFTALWVSDGAVALTLLGCKIAPKCLCARSREKVSIHMPRRGHTSNQTHNNLVLVYYRCIRVKIGGVPKDVGDFWAYNCLGTSLILPRA